VRTPPVQRYLIVQFLRIPRWGIGILATWVLLGFIAGWAFDLLQGGDPPVPLQIFCLPVVLFFLFVAVCVAEIIVRHFLTPFIWIARRLHRHG
jgi:hypothetical protein